MLSRRKLVTVTAVALAGGTAGCLDGLFGDETFEATAASVADAALSETGYEEHRTESVEIERTFEAGGESESVVVTNWHAEYDRAIDLGEVGLTDERAQAAIFTAVSTPQVEVLGRTFNPVAEMEAGEIAEMVQERYDGIGGVEQVSETTAPVAGESTTVGEFEAEAELVDAGTTVDVTLHISEAVESGDDLVVAVGGYPTLLAEFETEHVFTMMDAIEHDG